MSLVNKTMELSTCITPVMLQYFMIAFNYIEIRKKVGKIQVQYGNTKYN